MLALSSRGASRRALRGVRAVVAGHTEFVIDKLRAAAQALSEGDPDPLASLFAEAAEWRGLSSGHLWWKRTPS